MPWRRKESDVGVFEEADQGHPGDEATDVGEERDPATATTNAGAPADELKQKPKSEDQPRGDIHDSNEEENGEQDEHFGARK